jgi:hypothetical protein
MSPLLCQLSYTAIVIGCNEQFIPLRRGYRKGPCLLHNDTGGAGPGWQSAFPPKSRRMGGSEVRISFFWKAEGYAAGIALLFSC